MGPGGVLGRFEILGPLGRGAAGDVFLARDPALERTVALKTIRLDAPNVTDVEDARKRFRREAKITARLSHPHIVVVHEFGEEGMVLYLAMEYVPGGTLAQRLREPSFPLSERVLLMTQVAEALEHAHRVGVIHRDLKPANILLASPVMAKVSDFGIGKLVGGEADLTGTGQMVGSPAYMSPEQMRGEPVDARSDVFSFGVVLYQVLTGSKPFPAASLPMLVRRVQHEEAPDPRGERPELPAPLAELTLECLAKDAGRRPTAQDAARRLRAVLPLLPEEARAAAAPEEADAPRADDRGGEVDTPLTLPKGALEARAAETAILRRPAPVAVAVAAGAIGLAAVGLWAVLAPAGNGSDVAAARPDEPAAPSLVPSAVPATPTPLPAATPVPTPAPRRTPRPTPTPLPPGARMIRLQARSGLRLKVEPAQARVFVDGKLVGVADDWDGKGGGALLTFPGPGRRTIRLAQAGFADLLVELVVSNEADTGILELKETLAPGTPGGPTGPEGKLGRPDYRTHDGVRFSVRNPEALVIVDGRTEGLASAYREKELRLRTPAVHDVTIQAGPKKVELRVLASPSIAETATIDESL